ncbi:MAG: class I SAM-dependent methyltransferase, partial [Eubacteriales bacterium]
MMEETQFFSRTALFSAYYRAYHAMHDDPKIFDDFLACHLFEEDGREFLENLLAKSLQLYDPERAASCPDQATALALSMRALPSPSIVLGRARYAEDNLVKAVEQGVKQYVILGAGMDTFAFRCPELLDRLQVFEVDHPATQASKRDRLAKLGWEQPARLHFIPVDFTRDHLSAALARSSYDPQAPS